MNDSDFPEKEAKEAATFAWLMEQGQSRQREEMFMDGARWAFAYLREEHDKLRAENKALKELIHQKMKIIAAMDNKLFGMGVNFDFHEALAEKTGDEG